jgi:eukaryotic-like serine/threonine-protein kinase
MKRVAPEQAGFQPLGAMEPVGRATRERLAEGELWRLPGGDPARTELCWGMARGVGPFVSAGEDERGLWFVKDETRPRLAAFLKSNPDIAAGLVVFERLARLLASCERKGVFPGPLLPDRVLLGEPDREPCLPAEAWLQPLVGAKPPELTAERHNLRFFPAQQAAGAAWDAPANRYLFGLLLYELLAGEPAFAGQGLRLSLEERGQRAPAGFSADRAAALPPGLQSFCLRLLSADPAERPVSAAAIAAELRRFTKPERARGQARLAARVEPALPDAERKAEARRRALPLSLLGLLLGVVLCAVALGAGRGARREPPSVGRRAPLHGGASAQDCASCHPRHSAEWQGSVMAHAATSPLFQALEQLISEQIGRDQDCPDGAGILRPVGVAACRDRQTGRTVTGSGGQGWCSNCHLPSIQLTQGPPAFRALDGSGATRVPLAELVPKVALEGIACTVCHQAAGPVVPGAERRGEYEGNPSWTSTSSGRIFDFRPEARRGQHGIGNSGYRLDPSIFLADAAQRPSDLVPGGAHQRTPDGARRYQRSSEFCGSCHDVRLFGTDVLGAARGEHFKRLRNGYSEWADWARDQERKGEVAASCVDCHMSSFPGLCVAEPGARAGRGCPPGTRFEARPPGALPLGRSATNSSQESLQHPHFLSGVDLPLAPHAREPAENERLLDASGSPLGSRARRDLLLASALRLSVGRLERRGGLLEVPLTVENVGAGHRVPAGFSQEREIWLEVVVRDAADRLVYEVGRVARPDEDLADKRFLRVNTDDRLLDARGRPLGLFGADVADGPDAPRWSPPPDLGGRRFRGRGLVNFQNGFLRCVTCIGVVGADGRCRPRPGQEFARAARYDDGQYDQDSGACLSNLSGREALFETYFPVGGLDARRGLSKAPDAIVDTRSLAPDAPVEYVYELEVGRAQGPFRVEARLLFRAFPPYLLRAFIDYERRQSERSKRPSGPLIDARALERLEIVELGRVSSSGGST